MRRSLLLALLATTAASVWAHEGHDHEHDAPPAAAPPAPEEPAAQKPLVKEPPKLTHVFKPTTIKAPFLEQFTADWSSRWTPSEATKITAGGDETWSYVGQWSVETSSVYPAILEDTGLVAKTKAGHHAISAPFKKPLTFGGNGKPLVVQYEVKYQQGGNCGGGYLKLLEDGFQTKGVEFNDKTPWVVMFGPDLTCPGTKVHFIFRHQNPKTKEFEEKHLTLPPMPSIEKTTNLYTLVLNPDNTYKVNVNGENFRNGTILEDFYPPVNPEKEIDDPDDSKPSDWVDEMKIADPEATKPEDWDEDAPYEIVDNEAVKPEGWLDDAPLTIPDPDATKPEEWDDEEDGDWIAPTVRNPKCDEAPGCGEWKRPFKANPAYKGKWYPPQIDNPAYKGAWTARRIPNPKYFEDKNPVASLKKIGAVGIELWTMTEDILFDNIYVGHSEEDARALAAETFDIKRPIEAEAAKADAPPEPAADPLENLQGKPFKEDPIGYIRNKVSAFFDLLFLDPLLAFKTHPETGGALSVAFLTLISMVGALFGLVGAGQKGVTKAVKKVEEKAKDVKEKVSPAPTAPTAPAGETKKEETTTKKRK